MILSTVNALHDYLRHSRFKRFVRSEAPLLQTEQTLDRVKKYPRMPLIHLVHTAPSATLVDALAKRRSANAFSSHPMPQNILSGILATALGEVNARRTYPSGGGCLPIEAYVLIVNTEGFESGCYHVRPDLCALEFLWGYPEDFTLGMTAGDEWVKKSGALVVLTACWKRNIPTYSEFSLELALIEAGHVGQNIVLSAAAYEALARPLCGFREDVLSELFDLERAHEQIMYCIALGSKGE